MLLRKLLGHDIFISYSRADKGYARKLKEQLASMDYSCFIDYEKVFPGDRLSGALKRAIRWSSVFVLIGTDNSRNSRYVAQEMDEFLNTGRTMVPIFLGGALAKSEWAAIHDNELVWVDEPNAEAPSPIVFDEINRLFKHNRVKVWRRTAGTALTLVLLGLSVFATWQASEAREQQARAELKTAELVIKQKELEDSTAKLTAQQELLKKQNEDLEKGKLDLEKKTKEAEESAETARQQEQLARQNAERAKEQERIANERQRLAFSRELASNAVAQLQVDPELSLMLAAEAIGVDPNAQSEVALRRSLAESRLRGVAYDANGSAVSPDGRLLATAHSHYAGFEGGDNVVRVQAAGTGRAVAELRVGQKGLFQPVFSPDGRLLAATCGAREVCVFEVGTWRLLAELRGHTDQINSVRFSHDSGLVLTGAGDRTARVWEAATGRALAVLGAQPQPVKDAQFSPDDKLFLAMTAPEVLICEVKTGRVVKVLPNHGQWIISAAWSPDGKYVMTSAYGSPVRFWSTSDWQQAFELPSEYIGDAQLSPDGQRLLGITEGNAIVWEAKAGGKMFSFGNRNVISAAFGPGGDFVATANFDGSVGLWSYFGRSLAVMRGHTGKATHVAFSKDGRWVFTRGDDKAVRLWNSALSASLFVLRAHEGKPVTNSVLSPDGQVLVTAGQDDKIRIWETGTGKVLHVLNSDVILVPGVVFSPGGKFFLTVERSYAAHVWEVSSGRRVTDFKRSESHEAELFNPDAVSEAALSPDGKLAVTVTDDDEATVWATATGKVLYRPSDRLDEDKKPGKVESGGETTVLGPPTLLAVSAVAFSPDGERLLTAHTNYADRSVRVWDAQTGRNLFVLHGSESEAKEIKFSPDSRRAVTVGDDGAANVWDVRAGRSVAVLRVPSGKKINRARFGADGEAIITIGEGSIDGKWEMRQWQVSTQQSFVVAEFSAYLREISPDWKFAVHTNSYGEWEVLELSTGLPLAVLREQNGATNSFQFSTDGKLVVTAGNDGTARIYLCELCGSSQDLLGMARHRLGLTGRKFSKEERLKYLQGLPQDTAAAAGPKARAN